MGQNLPSPARNSCLKTRKKSSLSTNLWGCQQPHFPQKNSFLAHIFHFFPPKFLTKHKYAWTALTSFSNFLGKQKEKSGEVGTALAPASPGSRFSTRYWKYHLWISLLPKQNSGLVGWMQWDIVAEMELPTNRGNHHRLSRKILLATFVGNRSFGHLRCPRAGKTPPMLLENKAGKNCRFLGKLWRRQGHILHLNCLSLNLENSINPETVFQTISQCPGWTVLGATYPKIVWG